MRTRQFVAATIFAAAVAACTGQTLTGPNEPQLAASLDLAPLQGPPKLEIPNACDELKKRVPKVGLPDEALAQVCGKTKK